MTQRISTVVKLSRALREAHAPQKMIDLALAGHYDDFRSDVANPIMCLVMDARKCNLLDIAKRAMNGEFDAQDWEADAWFGSVDGQAALKELLGE